MAAAGDAERGQSTVGSVVRALRLLECFDRGTPELPLAEFVRRTGYSKSTAYRLLLTLEEAGWLERGAGGTFRLTIKPFEVGSILVDSLELRREAGPIMARMAAEVQATVYLVVPSGTRAVCLERIDSGSEVRIADLYVGGMQPLNQGAAPRALLAFNQDALLAGLLAEGLTGRTERSLVDPGELRADLQQIRRRGFSISDEDVTPGVGAIGAPVFGIDGRAIAAVSLGGLRARMLPPRPTDVNCLLEGSRELSRRLGYRAPIEADPATGGLTAR